VEIVSQPLPGRVGQQSSDRDTVVRQTRGLNYDKPVFGQSIARSFNDARKISILRFEERVVGVLENGLEVFTGRSEGLSQLANLC
jgi:hypothetical protein